MKIKLKILKTYHDFTGSIKAYEVKYNDDTLELKPWQLLMLQATGNVSFSKSRGKLLEKGTR